MQTWTENTWVCEYETKKRSNKLTTKIPRKYREQEKKHFLSPIFCPPKVICCLWMLVIYICVTNFVVATDKHWWQKINISIGLSFRNNDHNYSAVIGWIRTKYIWNKIKEHLFNQSHFITTRSFGQAARIINL